MFRSIAERNERMKQSTKLTCFKYSTFIGGFFLLFPSTVCWYWGNLSVYTDSYFRANLGPDSGFGSPWTVSLSMTGTAIGLFMSDMPTKIFGIHWTLGIFCVISSLTVGLSYFSVQNSVAALIITAGPLNGWSFGIISGVVLDVTKCWSNPKTVSMCTAFVMAGMGVGTLVLIELSTGFINPDNETPDLVVNTRAYFTQDEILDRVPNVFLVLLGLTLSCQIIGICFIRDVKYVQFVEENASTDIENSTALKSSDGDDRKGNCNESTALSGCNISPQSYSSTTAKLVFKEEDESNPSIQKPSQNLRHWEDHRITKPDKSSHSEDRMCDRKHLTDKTYEDTTVNATYSDHEKSNKKWQVENTVVNHVEIDIFGSKSSNGNLTMDKEGQGIVGDSMNMGTGDENRLSQDETPYSGDLSPVQLLKTPAFYIAWISVITFSFGFVTNLYYYKAYGQLWIADDHFLTAVGIVIPIGRVLTGFLWGLIIDFTGVKNTLIFFIFSLYLGLAFWYFTAMADKWLYLIWTGLVGTLISGALLIYAMVVLKQFGGKHFSKNYGLVLSGVIPVNLVGPVIMNLILEHIGWFALFFTGAILNSISLILLLAFFPKRQLGT